MRLFLFISLLMSLKAGAAPIDVVLSSLIDNNMPTQAKAGIYNNLLSLSRIPKQDSGSPLHETIFGGPPGGDLYINWLRQRVSVIRYDPQLKEVAKSGQAGLEFLLGPFKEPVRDEVIVGPRYFLADPIEQISILIHEARHRDGYYHVYRGSNEIKYLDPLPSPQTCMDSMGQFEKRFPGAYAAEIVFLTHLAEGLTPEMSEVFFPEIKSQFSSGILPAIITFKQLPSQVMVYAAAKNRFRFIVYPEHREQLINDLSDPVQFERLNAAPTENCH